MTIPDDVRKDVLEDLAALYLAGEATAGTRRLLEDYARQHPEFNHRLRGATQWAAPQPPAPAAADAEAQALRRTREAIRLRTLFTAMGIAFTLLPLSFTFHGNQVKMLFFPEQTGLIASFWSVAAASWVAMYVMTRAIGRRGL